MTYPASQFKHSWQVHLTETNTPSLAVDTFLSKRVSELDDDAVTAMILGGSYASGDATSYSDIDLTRFVQEPPEPTQEKRFTVPECAIFVVSGLRDAHILLDKHGAFHTLQQEAKAFRWNRCEWLPTCKHLLF